MTKRHLYKKERPSGSKNTTRKYSLISWISIINESTVLSARYFSTIMPDLGKPFRVRKVLG
jgi:hypothetical protein